MEGKIEQLLSNINNGITNLDEKQNSLVAYVLGLARHQILQLLYSTLKRIESLHSYIIAIVALGVALFAFGEASQGFTSRGLMIMGIGLIVYAIVGNVRLQAHIRTITKIAEEAEDTMSDTEELKAYLMGEAKK
jgi:hypothetical protein